MKTKVVALILILSVCSSHGAITDMEPIEPLAVAAGKNTMITCTSTTVTENPNDAILWLFVRSSDVTNSEVILSPNSNPEKIMIESNSAEMSTVSVLKLHNLELEDSGKYICQDTKDMNKFHTVVEVYTSPKLAMVTNPKDPVITHGANITLHCSTAGPPVTWTVNGNVVTETGPLDLDGDEDIDINVRPNNTLLVVNAELSDAGTYQCSLEHEVAGKTVIETQSIQLNAPLIMTLEESVSLEEGENARIPCTVTAYPLPVVSWSREEHPLMNGSDDGRIWITEVSEPGSNAIVSTLMIKKVSHEFRGHYVCNATYMGKTESEECLLRVKDRLAALWPFIGILIEVVVLVAIILICERRQKSKQQDYADDDDEMSETKKMNESVNSKEAEIRLRNMNA
ncbi:protein amalgam-like [Glandiceps talaboti]